MNFKITNDNKFIGILGLPKSGKTSLLKKISEEVKNISVFDYSFNDIKRVVDLINEASVDESYFYYLLNKYHFNLNDEISHMEVSVQKKLKIISVIVKKPHILILDDFDKDLNPFIKEQLVEMLLDYQKKFQSLVIFSTITPFDIVKFDARLILLHDYRVIIDMDIKDIFDYFGIINCTEAEFNLLNKEYIFSYLKNYYKYTVLIKNKKSYHNIDLVFEKNTIDIIVKLILGGEKIDNNPIISLNKVV